MKELNGKYRTVFHGTQSKKTAEQILKTGFLKGTYFARHLEDSICFGGKYVFYVVLKVFGDDWQLVCRKKILPSRIRQLVNFNPKEIYYNSKEVDKFFPKGKPCPCSSCGTDIGKVRLSILGKPVVAKCPKCKKRLN